MRKLESIRVNPNATPLQKKRALATSVLLIETLGFGAAAKEVKEGKQTAADTLTFVANSTREPRRQRVARLGAAAAAQAGI